MLFAAFVDLDMLQEHAIILLPLGAVERLGDNLYAPPRQLMPVLQKVRSKGACNFTSSCLTCGGRPVLRCRLEVE